MAKNPTKNTTTRKKTTNSADTNSGNNKRQKRPSDMDSITADLICPITLELPHDPVVAEDGRVYERAAIKRHIDNNEDRGLKSPLTSEPMGRRLVACPQTKNHIKTLVDKKVIRGELAKEWQKKETKNEELEKLTEKAEAGDAEDIYNLGYTCYYGVSGAPEDHKTAYKWFEKGADKEDAKSIALMGECLLHGYGVEANERHAILLLTSAACKGSDLAAAHLGDFYKDGLCGMPINKKKATHWYKKAVAPAGPNQHLAHKAKKGFNKVLQELENDVNDD